MKNFSRTTQRLIISKMSLADKTKLFWDISTACNHPKHPGLPCGEVIELLSDIIVSTTDNSLVAQANLMLNLIIGVAAERSRVESSIISIMGTKQSEIYGTKADIIIIDDVLYDDDLIPPAV